MRTRLPVVLTCTVLLCVASAARATPIVGGPTGLTNPDNVITFDELGNLQGQVITDQFAAFGATFEGFGWDNSTEGQTGSTGFDGGDLVNGIPGFPIGFPAVISFNDIVTDAAFATVDQDGTFTVSSFIGGVGGSLVETFDIMIPFNPGAGFIGFRNSQFDTITLSGTDAIAIDNLQFNPASEPSDAVPEPSSLVLLCVGAVGCCSIEYGRRRGRRTR